ncbi:MAG: prepilin-type N-terminal cleavage/methylation domain-containing protein [Phycisphaerae bacterium]
MSHNSYNLAPRSTRAFTLIEILVTIAIILVLIAILVAVGSNVRRNAQISATRAELQGLAGLIEQFEKDNNQPAPVTIYNNDDASTTPKQLLPTTPANQPNFVDVLYLYPKTKDALVHLAGDKLKTIPGTNSMYILDSFGRPINFIPQNFVYAKIPGGSDFTPTPADRDYLRSSGPDQTTIWAKSKSAANSDDVLSYEAAH